MSETNKRYVKWRIRKAKIIVLKFKIKGFCCFMLQLIVFVNFNKGAQLRFN